MPQFLDQFRPSAMWRWDASALSWISWDGSLTAGAITIGKVDQGAAGAAAWPVSLATAPTTPVTGVFWQNTQPVSLATAPSTPVTGVFWQNTQPVSLATAPTTPVTNASLDGLTLTTLDTDLKTNVGIASMPNTIAKSTSRADTYTATGNGVAITATANPFKAYAVQVVGTGASAAGAGTTYLVGYTLTWEEIPV